MTPIDLLLLVCIFVLGIHGHVVSMLIVGGLFAYRKLSRHSTKLDSRKQ